MGNRQIERRDSERAEIEIPVTYSHANTFFYDYINNISLGGTFIRTQNYLPIGTRFRFIIKLPNQKEELSLKAEVVWVREREEVVQNRVLPQGMGIKFIFDSEDEKREFTEKIDRLIRGHLGDKLAERLLRNKR
jgi:uncharacterized protein (TIGR02266 family)